MPRVPPKRPPKRPPKKEKAKPGKPTLMKTMPPAPDPSDGATTEEPPQAEAPEKEASEKAAVEDADTTASVPDQKPLTIVGIGASAGGLEALFEVLRHLPETNGMALVFIQHLAPKHISMLPELISNVSNIPVVQIAEGMSVEPDRIHVIGPNTIVEVRDRRFVISPRSADPEQQNHQIDVFFRSLASTAQGQAIGIVLSGTGSDGAAGLAEIKVSGGIAIAQSPETARYDGMPRSAIATGAVDLVRSPELIAQELVQLGRHPYLRVARARAGADELVISEQQLSQMFAILRSSSGIDFTPYKRPTIKRRLRRRMVLQKMEAPDTYIKLLGENLAEAKALSRDILITVTRFFRDPDSYDAMKRLVFPAIVANSDRATPIRIWIPGCSTGEEVYSVAISILEYIGDSGADVRVQIFATDVSEEAVNTARTGTYGENILADVSFDRLRRFFSKIDGSHRIQKAVRDMCIFARQDITRDPPFSKLDLIVCRNVLIYLDQPLQRRLMNIFHYALRPRGYLVLASSETVSGQSDLFSLVDKKHKIYEREMGVTTVPSEILENRPFAGTAVQRSVALKERSGERVMQEAQNVLLNRYAPAGVVVDVNYEIVQFHGHTGRFLEHPPGDPSRSVLKMAREGLLHALRSTLHEARRTAGEVVQKNVRVRSNGGHTDLNLRVIPIAKEGHYLVLFEELDGKGGTSLTTKALKGAAKGKRPGKAEDSEVPRLRAELLASREYLQSIIQDLEAANEELQSANEEILSSNEELQSTNEELDTAKEELQSTNEELNTVNDELQARNEELSRANSDLLNLLSSVQIAVVIVASDLRIRRFTPMAEKVLNLIPGDIGRPIGHIKPNIDCPQLEQLIYEVIDTVGVRELEVKDRQGAWFLLRIRPYKSVNNQIDGAVLALIDIEAAKKDRGDGTTAREFADGLVELSTDPLVIVAHDTNVRAVSRLFAERFGVDRAAMIGQPLALPNVKRLLDEAAGKDRAAAEIRASFADKDRALRLSAKKLQGGDSFEPLYVLKIDEVPQESET